MRRYHVSFDCEGSQLIGTFDEAEGATAGLLLVSGGSELRSGAWGGQARLAARLADAGYSVYRFDRRGVGDSEGPNGEFRSSAPDIAAALADFRARAPELTRFVGFGNCDAASALMLTSGAGFDALVLSNPWTIEDDNAAPPPEALRQHYRQRLGNRGAIKRLLTGQVSPGRLLAGLKQALRPAPPPGGLAQDMAQGLAGFPGPVTFLLAERDRTAQAFLAAWPRNDPRLRRCSGASHSYVEPEARDWLAERLIEALRG